MINIWDFYFIRCYTTQPSPPHEVGHASKPTLSMGFPITLANDSHCIGTVVGEVNALDRG